MTKDKDVSHLFCGIKKKPVNVKFIKNMCTIEPDREINWVWHTFKGFKKLFNTSKREIKSFASIGTGSGVDAIGAAAIFNDLEKIYITDVENEIVDLAHQNVINNVRSCISVESYVGDLCDPLKNQNICVDVIYSNLPNLPSLDDDSSEFNQNSYYVRGDKSSKDKQITDFLLDLQYQFLVSSRSALNEAGVVLCMMGGRFPYEMFGYLGDKAGFEMEEIVCGLKIQSEPLDSIPGYSHFENDELSFDYYIYEEAVKELKEQIPSDGKQLKELLLPCKISARDALKAVREGKNVGHTFHLWMGSPLNTYKRN